LPFVDADRLDPLLQTDRLIATEQLKVDVGCRQVVFSQILFAPQVVFSQILVAPDDLLLVAVELVVAVERNPVDAVALFVALGPPLLAVD